MPARRSSGITAAAYSDAAIIVAPLIGNAEASPEVDVLERKAGVTQLQRERDERLGGTP